jgi:Bromodomain/PWWP domain
MSVYSKIVKRPIDLGKVCRRIRRRTYRDTRSIRMDMWRIFSNCIRYHTHPGNKENAVPAFISISLHLRSYFNALWQEYMLPSDFSGTLNGKQPRGSAVAMYREALDKRDTDRIQRLHGTGSTLLSKKCIEKLKLSIHEFVRAGGCVDVIDKEPVFGMDDQDDEEGDLQAFLENISQYQKRLEDAILNDTEYSVDEMVRDIKRCYSTDLFENRPSFRACIASRLDRLVGKMVVPIYETSCRGVNQSSIWGCMAAAIWARESSKKPYWPALVLGIMAPDCQREAWHAELTARNESRLPEKLLNELQVGKRKAEQSLKRDTKLGPQQLSYFLVEFMGTHEFIWVKEGDIIETFDPEEDPNLASGVGNVTKKKRSFRSIAESKTFQAAIEEGRWALEEFEMQLSDACGDHGDDDDADEEQEMNYSYAILSQSDDEADDEEEDMYDETNLTASDIEEANEMLASDGMIDYSIEGRKNARKRSLARKKEKVNAVKAAAKKEKTDHSKKSKDKKVRIHKEGYDKISSEAPNEDLRDGIDLPMKRKVEKDPFLKSKKKQKTDSRIDPVSKLTSKRGRATAIINGYLTRLLKKEEMKNLCLAGVLSMPASVVDAQGLLGMALAFRAAAGEIPVPDDADYKFKPWKQIDADSPVTSAERIKKLEKQLSMIRHKVEEVKTSTSKRKRLTEIAIDKKHRFEEDILALESAAKKDIMSRTLKKKPVFRGDLKACGDTKPPISSDTNGEGTEVVVQGGYDDGDAAKAVEELQATVYEDDDDDDDDESD